MEDKKPVPTGIVFCAGAFYFFGFVSIFMILTVWFGGFLGDIDGPGVVKQSLVLFFVGLAYLASAFGMGRGKVWAVYLGVFLGLGLSALYFPMIFNSEFSIVRMVFLLILSVPTALLIYFHKKYRYP